MMMAADLRPIPAAARFDHIGMLVRDADAGAAFCARIWGLADVNFHDYRNDTARVHGRLASYQLRVAMGTLPGGIQLELIEARTPGSVHDEFARTAGEGVDHLAVSVGDLDAAVAHHVRAGHAIALDPGPERPNVAYVDTRATGGLFLELCERGFHERRAKAALTPRESLLSGARLDHIAMVTRDCSRAIEHMEALDFGPFRAFDYENEGLIYGRPQNYALRIATGKLAPNLELEVIQTVSGENEVHERFLNERGEGIEHIAFEVPDLEASIRDFEAAGFPVILTRRSGPPGSVYIDTTRVGGLITELIRSGFKPYDLSTWPDLAASQTRSEKR